MNRIFIGHVDVILLFGFLLFPLMHLTGLSPVIYASAIERIYDHAFGPMYRGYLEPSAVASFRVSAAACLAFLVGGLAAAALGRLPGRSDQFGVRLLCFVTGITILAIFILTDGLAPIYQAGQEYKYVFLGGLAVSFAVALIGHAFQPQLKEECL